MLNKIFVGKMILIVKSKTSIKVPFLYFNMCLSVKLVSLSFSFTDHIFSTLTSSSPDNLEGQATETGVHWLSWTPFAIFLAGTIQ